MFDKATDLFAIVMLAAIALIAASVSIATAVYMYSCVAYMLAHL